MTIQEFAKQIDGREYPFDLTKDEEAQAKSAGLVVVFGSSDDLMEFRGAIYEEVGAYEGTTVSISSTGKLMEDGPDEDEREVLQKFGVLDALKKSLGEARQIKAIWSDGEYSWTFKTEIPRATFEVTEDGGKYCRGIVFEAWW